MFLSVCKEKKITNIPLVQIRPCRTQARHNFNDEKLRELAVSIKQNGILQPVTVRKISSSEYEIIAGERRLRAAAMCGKAKIPCIVIACSEEQAVIYSMIENIQRTDLNFFEEAEGISKLMKFCGLTQQETARRLGKKQSTIANKLRVLKLTDEEKELMMKAHLTERHARALLKINDVTDRRILLSEMIENNMNVTQSEKHIDLFIKRQKVRKQQKQKQTLVIKDIRIFENTIKRAIETMRMSGVNALSSQSENDRYIEYTVRIPKSKNDEENHMTA